MFFNYLKKIKLVILLLLISFNISAIACINDADSIFFETQKFPNELELLTGDFITHSNEFYSWRINDRLNKIKKEPNNLFYYDDLAVSYEKIGETKKAIDILEEINIKNPNRYETLANLGTFYIHNKQYKKGVELLKQAVLINPQAHFGREIYQIKLVEYILKENQDGKFEIPIQKSNNSFADFILKTLNINKDTAIFNDDLEPEILELLKAIIGIGGMLKFGNSDSPVLLEAMGDLYKKMDLLNSKYITKNYNTKFEDLAVLFYAASIIKSKDNIKDINDYENKFKKLLKIKKISNTHSLSTIYDYLNQEFKNVKIKKDTFFQKEIELINIGENVEKNIYTKLYPTSQEKEDLLQLQKINYFNILNDTKEIYYQNIEKNKNSFKDILYFNFQLFVFIFFCYYIFIITNYFVKKIINIKANNKIIFNIKRHLLISKRILIFFLIYNTIILFYVVS